MTLAMKNNVFAAALGLAMSVVGFAAQSVVHGEAVEAVVAEKLATHNDRLVDLEKLVKILADSQARTAATQTSMGEVLKRMDERHSDDVRELRGKRR